MTSVASTSSRRRTWRRLIVFATSFYTYDRPKTNLDINLQYYPSLSDPGRQRLQLDASVKREFFKDLFVATQSLQHLRQPPAKPHGQYQRHRRRRVNWLELLSGAAAVAEISNALGGNPYAWFHRATSGRSSFDGQLISTRSGSRRTDVMGRQNRNR